jgi:cysteinyl-tRNA synthetase
MPPKRQLMLTNTLTRSKQAFTPRQPGLVKMFTCGPSVYRQPHLGNYRTFLFEDLLQRTLEGLGWEVRRVINFTDVEDKAIREAKAQGRSLEEQTRPMEELFQRECRLLGIRLPREMPRSSTSVATAAELIQALLERGYAYWHQGNVFFEPLKYQGFGRLYGLDLSRWPDRKVRFKKDTYPGQRWNLGDFILWHGCAADDLYCWHTGLGPGRPAWNIQDPAMIHQSLGPAIDIHCGGVDNLFRHHDYNLAIMEAATGREFCPWWLHGEHLLIDGAKMSKSKGNIVYLDDILAQGRRPAEVRFFLLSGHYRRKLDLTHGAVNCAAGRLAALRELTRRLGEAPEGGRSSDRARELVRGLGPAFWERLCDDLDAAGAVEALQEGLTGLDRAGREGHLGPGQAAEAARAVAEADRVLGVLGD